MNVIECKSVVFHSPFIMCGKNFGANVEVAKYPGLKLYYNIPLRMLFAEYKGIVSFFDTFHVATPVNGDILKQSPAVEETQSAKPKPAAKPKNIEQ